MPQKPQIIFYYANWCGHCHALKHVRSRLQKTQNIHDIDFQEYEADNDANIVQDAGVRGFPTIKIIAGGSTQDYTRRSLFKNELDYLNQFTSIGNPKPEEIKQADRAADALIIDMVRIAKTADSQMQDMKNNNMSGGAYKFDNNCKDGSCKLNYSHDKYYPKYLKYKFKYQSLKNKNNL